MNEFEFWLVVRISGEPACTIFGRIAMAVRPLVGERISFMQEKGSTLEIQVEWPNVGWRRGGAVSVEIDDVSHYAVRGKHGVQFTAVVRTVPLNVRTAEDARAVRDILTKQFGFEVDPYGVNTLEGGAEA